MSDVVGAIFILMLGLMLGALGCWVYHRTQGPQEIIRTDTVHREEERPPEPPQPPPDPDTRIIYRTTVDTVRDCFQVPTQSTNGAPYRVHGLMERNPLQLTPTRATITYFQPDAGRYEEAVYSIPTRDWSLWTEGTLALTPVGTMLQLTPGITYQDRWSFYGGLMAVNDEHLTMGWTAGIRYRFTIATF